MTLALTVGGSGGGPKFDDFMSGCVGGSSVEDGKRGEKQ
jgi:hypothetical protein